MKISYSLHIGVSILILIGFPSSACHSQPQDIGFTNLGIEFVYVQSGTFQMGDQWDVGFSKDETPVHTVRVSSFWISKYEITNAQFCVFLNERGNAVEEGVPWIDITDKDCRIQKRGRRFEPKRGYWFHPVVEVTWYGARAFAEWVGCRLPTEAEWEYAARCEGRDIMYPHGGMLTHKDANFAGRGDRDKWARTSPVGSFPPSPLGLYDMSGNVWERCWDWYDEFYYSREDVGADPAGPDSGMYRIMRGGSWDYSRINCRTTIRGMNRPNDAVGDIGFRVARDGA